MKYVLFTFIVLSIFSTACIAQNLTLKVSNPQPRLGEDFTISVEIDTICRHFFANLDNLFELTPGRGRYEEPISMNTNAIAKKIGKYPIGPFNFDLNGAKYKTNKVTVEVVDSLPAINQGVWIRKVPINDSVIVILIDQRIPALKYITRTQNSISSTLQASEDEKLVELTNEAIDGLTSFDSSSSTATKTIYMPTGEVSFKSCFHIYYVTLKDKRRKISLTKNAFNNLPADYKFEDIPLN